MRVGLINICKEKMLGRSEERKCMEQFLEDDIPGKAL